jgi:citrate synthase
VTGYAVVDVAKEMGDYDWRFADTNIWKVERMLLGFPHRAIKTSDARTKWLRARYRAFRKKYGPLKPVIYERRERWMPLPREFDRSRRLKWV